MNKYISLVLCLLILSIAYAIPLTWYSQNDARWRSERLGGGSSIERSGCVLSCLSMLLNAEASNPQMTPAQLNKWLKLNGGYYGNSMRWQIPGQIDGQGSGLELEAQSTRLNDWDFLSSELAKGNKVIVKVRGRYSHWVLVFKQDGPANKASSYHVNDPGLDRYEARTLAHWGGFRSARSYSGKWLDEDTFNLDSDITVVPISEDEYFLYELYNVAHPADVYVTLTNNLDVDVKGFFILGLFDKSKGFLQTLDFDFQHIPANGKIDLLFEMTDVNLLQTDGRMLKVIYSKYFTHLPSETETINLGSFQFPDAAGEAHSSLPSPEPLKL